jgi:hypothetical protein
VVDGGVCYAVLGFYLVGQEVRVRDVQWAAGLFEGEGCFSINTREGRPRSSVATCQLRMVDEDVVRAFHEVVGVGALRLLHQSPQREAKGYQPVWAWYSGAQRDVRHVIEMFYPYLGDRRKKRADELLALLDSKGESNV